MLLLTRHRVGQFLLIHIYIYVRLTILTPQGCPLHRKINHHIPFAQHNTTSTAPFITSSTTAFLSAHISSATPGCFHGEAKPSLKAKRIVSIVERSEPVVYVVFFPKPSAIQVSNPQPTIEPRRGVPLRNRWWSTSGTFGHPKRTQLLTPCPSPQSPPTKPFRLFHTKKPPRACYVLHGKYYLCV